MVNKWISVTSSLPEKEGYYQVKFSDGTEDRKPYRIRPNQKVRGFVTEKEVIAWK